MEGTGAGSRETWVLLSALSGGGEGAVGQRKLASLVSEREPVGFQALLLKPLLEVFPGLLLPVASAPTARPDPTASLATPSSPLCLLRRGHFAILVPLVKSALNTPWRPH